MGGGLEAHALGGDGGGEFFDLGGEVEELFVGERVGVVVVEVLEFGGEFSVFHVCHDSEQTFGKQQRRKRKKRDQKYSNTPFGLFYPRGGVGLVGP